MKKIGVLSTVFAFAATATLASETTHHTTPPKRMQTIGRTYASILSPVSVSLSQNMQSSAPSEETAKNGKNRAVNQGEIRLLGPKNQLVTVTVQNAEIAERKPSEHRLTKNSRMLALNSLAGEAKIRINGEENAKRKLNAQDNSPKTYVFQVSY